MRKEKIVICVIPNHIDYSLFSILSAKRFRSDGHLIIFDSNHDVKESHEKLHFNIGLNDIQELLRKLLNGNHKSVPLIAEYERHRNHLATLPHHSPEIHQEPSLNHGRHHKELLIVILINGATQDLVEQAPHLFEIAKCSFTEVVKKRVELTSPRYILTSKPIRLSNHYDDPIWQSFAARTACMNWDNSLMKTKAECGQSHKSTFYQVIVLIKIYRKIVINCFISSF